MKIMNIRIDQKVAEIIDRNAGKQRIKPSRYVRSLIEKGLVLDHQIQAGYVTSSGLQHESKLWPKLFNLAVENVELARSVVWQAAKTGEEAKEIVDAAQERAKKYVEKHIEGKEPE
jgi:DNA-directed RNA polymerase beta' subunit